jgi:GT2 family glycosyltransferase
VRVSIVLPTVDGRGAIYDKVVAAYGATRPTGWEFTIDTPENYATVGEAWNAGAEDALDADYVFFAIDDAVPHHGWAQVAARTVDAGYIPAPRLELPDGSLESCGSLGFGNLLPECADRTPCRSCGLFFVNPDWISQVGAFLPTHYAVDDDWAWRASLHDIRVLYRSEMRFTHYHEQRGTLGTRAAAPEHNRAMIDHAATLTLPERLVPA